MKPSGPNLLDEPLKDFIVIPAYLPRKGVKRLATSGERVNHDSWVKMCNLCRGLKTSILAELMVRSGLGYIYIKSDDFFCVKYAHCLLFNALHYLCHIDHEIVGYIQPSCYTCGVRHGLTLAIPHTPQEKFWACHQPVSWIL